MEEKKVLKINLSTFFLIFAIIVIVIMGYFIYEISIKKSSAEKRIADLTEEINALKNTTKTLQDKISKNNNMISEGTNNSGNLSSEIEYVTYSKNGIEFKYPSTFKQTNDTFSTSGFEAVEDSDGNRFQLQDENISDSITIEEIVKREQNLDMPDGSNYRTLTKNQEYITLANGVKGYKFESTTQDNSYQIMFFTQNDNKVYEFTFTIEDKSKYDNYIGIANKILDSLKIK